MPRWPGPWGDGAPSRAPTAEILFLQEKQNFYKITLKAFEAARSIFELYIHGVINAHFKRDGPRPGPEDRWAQASEGRPGETRGPGTSGVPTKATTRPDSPPRPPPIPSPVSPELVQPARHWGEKRTGRAKTHRKRRRRAAAHFRLPSRNPSGIEISVPGTWVRLIPKRRFKNRAKGGD